MVMPAGVRVVALFLGINGESPGLFILSPDDGAQPGMRIK